MCETKSNVIEITDKSYSDYNHPFHEAKIRVWYCKNCNLFDIETNTVIASLFQGVL